MKYSYTDKTWRGQTLRKTIDRPLADLETYFKDPDIAKKLGVFYLTYFIVLIVLHGALAIKGFYWYIIPMWAIPAVLQQGVYPIYSKLRHHSFFDFRAMINQNDILIDFAYTLVLTVGTRSILVGMLYFVQTLLSSSSKEDLSRSALMRRYKKIAFNGS